MQSYTLHPDTREGDYSCVIDPDGNIGGKDGEEDTF